MTSLKARYITSKHLGDAGWSSPVARQAHNLKVVGSNPAPATNLFNDLRGSVSDLFLYLDQIWTTWKIFGPINFPRNQPISQNI